MQEVQAETALLTGLLRGLDRERDLARRADETLAEVGLLAHADRVAGTLSYGDRRLVEMAIVLARRPRLVLLDEPTAGMNPVEVQAVAALIRQVAAEGRAVLLVEPNARLALAVSHHAYVLEHGRLALEGSASQLAQDPRVQAAYLGGKA